MRFTTLIISLILTFSVAAQNRDVIDFKYKKLNIPLVTSLSVTNQFYFFSSDHLLWFSTRQGLTSFDGVETISYYSDTSESVKYGLSNIRAMAEDKNKNLWIASGDDPVLSYFNTNTKKITKVSFDKRKKSLTEKIIKALFIDSAGLLWMTTYEKGFYIYNTNDSTVEYYNIGPGLLQKHTNGQGAVGISMTPYYSDPQKMWIGTIDGIFLFSLKTRKAEKVFEFPHNAEHIETPIGILYMDTANDSTLCLGTEFYGMGIYNTKRNTLTMFPPYKTLKMGTPPYPTAQDGYLYLTLFSVAKKSLGKYYLYYMDSLPLIFNCNDQKYTQLTNPDFKKEIKKSLVKMVVDKKGNLWIGESKCLYVLSDEFNLFYAKESPETDPLMRMNTLYEAIWDKGIKNYYAATMFSNKQIYQLDSNFQLIKKISTLLPQDGGYFKLLLDSSNNIWGFNPGNEYYKSPGSISIYKKGSNEFVPVERIYPQLTLLNKMNNMTSDNKGNLIFSNSKGNLYFLNYETFKLDSLVFPHVDSSEQFKNINDFLFYDSSSKCVYVSNTHNILQYNFEKKITHVFAVGKFRQIKKEDFFYFTLDADGQIWTLSLKPGGNEIHIFNGKTFSHIKKVVLKNTKNEKLNEITIRSGPSPYMFITLEEGMALYNYEDNTFRLFDKENGLLYDFIRRTNYVNNTYISSQGKTIQYVALDKLISLTSERIPRINRVTIYGGKTVSFLDFSNNKFVLDYKRNTIGISYSAIEYLFPERIQYAFRLSVLDNDWKFSDYKSREIVYSNLAPGKYVFQLKAQMLGGNWQNEPVELIIIITPPFWQTWWFRILGGLFIVGVVFYFIRSRIASVRKKEQLKALHEKKLLELEAKALRAQMNPHFIFNSMNSIKSLINKSENDKAASYLTTFSKLIRTLFQNSDKREVSLYEELETCKLYTQLEKMRFGDKVEFVFNVDEAIDLKDFKVPALILQPFIENAIWHGLIPRETGGKVTISVKKNDGAIQCIIDDNGIGREQSKQFKPQYEATYQSKGIGLTQSRLELDKLLNEREDAIFIIDKEDENGQPEGTKVIISFKENRN